MTIRCTLGLDVHKETIAVSTVLNGREDSESPREIANRPQSVKKLVGKLNERFYREVLLSCYQAELCGYVLYR